MTSARTAPPTPDDLFALDGLFTEEERETAPRCGAGSTSTSAPTSPAGMSGEIPARDLAKASASSVCSACTSRARGAPAHATTYGLACIELEAVDSGVRSLVSVQGSLAMFAIHRFGSEDQRSVAPPDGQR